MRDFLDMRRDFADIGRDFFHRHRRFMRAIIDLLAACGDNRNLLRHFFRADRHF